MHEYLTRPVGVRLDRLRRTPAEIAGLPEGRDRAARGRTAVGEWVASLAGHDDNHLAQLRRTLDGRP